MTIDDYSIGDVLKHKQGFIGEIVEKTNSSINLYHKARTKNGINCTQWYGIQDIIKEFKKHL
tara:strand:+ start:107 stop:292 length:186 start_codon:yes stop_codon:yes gene_type:complete